MHTTMGIVVEDGILTLRMSDGIPVAFPLPTEKKPSFIRAERKEARKEKDGYCIWDMDEDLYYRSHRKNMTMYTCWRACRTRTGSPYGSGTTARDT